jgi:hypothetical protein
MDGAYDLGKAYRLLKRMGIKPCQNAFTLRKTKLLSLEKLTLSLGVILLFRAGVAWDGRNYANLD